MRPTREKLIEGWFLVSAVASSLVTVSILLFMLIMGLPLIAGGHFFELFTAPWDPDHGEYGIRAMIMGTLAIAPLGLLIALPVCLGTAALVTSFAPRGPALLIRRFVQLMTGIPTVVYGFIGVFLLVPLIREMFGRGTGMCVLTAALLVAVLVSPTMILFFNDAINAVPRHYLQAVDAVGGSKVQRFCHVVLPQAWRGILGGIVIAMGRAFGDTMIALMVAGNAALVPDSLAAPARTLTSHIALIKAADYHSLEFKSIFACGLALYVIATILVVTVRQLARNGEARA